MTDAGIEQIHIEVGDGVFSPDITVGSHVVKSLRKITDAVIDVHLMTIRPENKIVELVQAGANILVEGTAIYDSINVWTTSPN